MNHTRHKHDICTWWHAYFFDNPLRRLLHSPRRMFAGYLFPGMTAVDIGCGMGFFSINMAKIVSDQGKILALDVQHQMLSILRRRANRAGVSHIIDTHLCEKDEIGLNVTADFVLLFWAMHEIPDAAGLARQITAMLKPGGACFLAEPAFHVTDSTFKAQAAVLIKAGLREIARPQVVFSRTAVFQKSADIR